MPTKMLTTPDETSSCMYVADTRINITDLHGYRNYIYSDPVHSLQRQIIICLIHCCRLHVHLSQPHKYPLVQQSTDRKLTQNSSSLPSNRHHQNNDDCLEGKRENYQVCSVQYCVQQLCTVQCTHILSHRAHFTVRRFIFVHVLLLYFVYITSMCSIVTR